MGFYPSVMKCRHCNEQWNAFFCSVDMSSSGLDKCPACGRTDIVTIKGSWSYSGQRTLDWGD